MNVIKHATAHDNDEKKNEPRIDFQIHTQSSAQPNNIACYNFDGIKIEFQLNCRCCWIYWYCAVRWQLFNDNGINKTILIFWFENGFRHHFALLTISTLFSTCALRGIFNCAKCIVNRMNKLKAKKIIYKINKIDRRKKVMSLLWTRQNGITAVSSCGVPTQNRWAILYANVLLWSSYEQFCLTLNFEWDSKIHIETARFTCKRNLEMIS